MAKIYCVCEDASEEVCNTCSKYRELRPKHTVQWQGWKRRGTTVSVGQQLQILKDNNQES